MRVREDRKRRLNIKRNDVKTISITNKMSAIDDRFKAQLNVLSKYVLRNYDLHTRASSVSKISRIIRAKLKQRKIHFMHKILSYARNYTISRAARSKNSRGKLLGFIFSIRHET